MKPIREALQGARLFHLPLKPVRPARSLGAREIQIPAIGARQRTARGLMARQHVTVSAAQIVGDEGCAVQGVDRIGREIGGLAPLRSDLSRSTA